MLGVWMTTNFSVGFYSVRYSWSLALVRILLCKIFLELGLGAVDGVLIWMPNEMFRFWIGIGRSDIGFAIDVDGFDLPIGEIRQLFLDEIFEIVRSEIGLNIFGDRIENLIKASEIGFIGLKFLD